MTQEQTRTFRVRKGMQITDAFVQELMDREVDDVEIVRWSVDHDPVHYDAYEGWMNFDREHDEVLIVYTERRS